jgi:hypothetical protein
MTTPWVTITRTNDTNAYTANDVVGAATGSSAAVSFRIDTLARTEKIIAGAELRIDASAVISGETSYNLHLYTVTPPSALGDNAAWDLPSGDRASYLGAISLGTPVDIGSTLYVNTDGLYRPLTGASGLVYAYLVTVGAYTPTASRVHNIRLHTIPVN